MRLNDPAKFDVTLRYSTSSAKQTGTYKLRAYHNGDMVGKELDVVVKPAPAELPLKVPLVVGEDPKKEEPKKDEKK